MFASVPLLCPIRWIRFAAEASQPSAPGVDADVDATNRIVFDASY
jgi:hypothetical protein